MKISVENDYSIYTGLANAALAAVLTQVEGRKIWLKNPTRLKFETSEHNLRIFRSRMPMATIDDKRPPKDFMASMDFGQGTVKENAFDNAFGTPAVAGIQWEDDKTTFPEEDGSPLSYPFRMPPYGYQMQCFRKLSNVPNHAIYAAPGTGKTKMHIDITCKRYLEKEVELMVVIAWPKGVHHQWVEDEIPKHVWEGIETKGDSWNGKKIDERLFKRDGKLTVFTTNVESVNSPKFREQFQQLLEVYKGKISLCVDESQTIKNPSSKRSEKILKFGQLASFRTCLTGTPIAKDLRDQWGQFMFLDPDIIGIKYKTAFQAMYCVMGGYENDSVVQHRNVDHFKNLVNPFQYRVSKEPLGLPPMVTDEVTFSMSDEQKRLQKDLKETFSAMLSNGEIVSVVNAASMFIRLQQIASGYAVDENGIATSLSVNPRLDALSRLVDGIDGRKLIWCRFKQDIERLIEIYGDRAMHYYGPTKKVDRDLAIKRFTDPNDDLEFLIASPAAAGAGLNLQGACHHAIFYTNSFNFIDREQAESRIHRIGTKSTVFNFDLIARGSVDRYIINNLRRKKDFSDFILDDIRRMVDEI